MGENVKNVSIIGGADGPTSFFIAGKNKNPGVLGRIKRTLRRKKRAKIEKKIVAAPHTPAEVVLYIKQKYHAVEVPSDERRYQEQQRCMKEALIMQYRPELLGESKKAEEIGNDVFPIDYHLYEIPYPDGGRITVEIENVRNKFGPSYSGNKKTVSQLRRISKDISSFYGVTEDDIKNRSERFHALVSTLCS